MSAPTKTKEVAQVITNNGYNQQIFSQQWTQTLSQLYPTYEDFLADYNEINLKDIPFSDYATSPENPAFLKTIYLLLMGEYGSSAIQSLSPDRFKLRFFTRIMAYGPLYEKQLKHQKTLLSMTDDELRVSAKAIHNSARNPSQKPPTDSEEILPYIDAQSTTNHQRSLMDAYAYFDDVADDSLTKKFIKRFDDMFVIMTRTNSPLWYITNEGDYTV